MCLEFIKRFNKNVCFHSTGRNGSMNFHEITTKCVIRLLSFFGKTEQRKKKAPEYRYEKHTSYVSTFLVVLWFLFTLITHFMVLVPEIWPLPIWSRTRPSPICYRVYLRNISFLQLCMSKLAYSGKIILIQVLKFFNDTHAKDIKHQNTTLSRSAPIQVYMISLRIVLPFFFKRSHSVLVITKFFIEKQIIKIALDRIKNFGGSRSPLLQKGAEVAI